MRLLQEERRIMEEEKGGKKAGITVLTFCQTDDSHTIIVWSSTLLLLFP